ncbi:hypothetical protein TI04_12940 [Achromatium sp. WMS2]|nr:hypothetical protein TI04_12940 [Achromatium sp. WMS2]
MYVTLHKSFVCLKALIHTSVLASTYILCIYSIPVPIYAGWFTNQDQDAAQAFAAGYYERAAQKFADPYRKGIAQYRAGNYQAAVKSFEHWTSYRHRLYFNVAGIRISCSNCNYWNLVYS